MFVLDLSKTYWWPVVIELPSSKSHAKAGEMDKFSFEVEFRRLKKTEFNAIFDNEGMTDADILRQFVVGWRKVMTSPTEEMPFSKDAIENLIEEAPGMANAIATAFLTSAAGGAKAKN